MCIAANFTCQTHELPSFSGWDTQRYETGRTLDDDLAAFSGPISSYCSHPKTPDLPIDFSQPPGTVARPFLTTSPSRGILQAVRPSNTFLRRTSVSYQSRELGLRLGLPGPSQSVKTSFRSTDAFTLSIAQAETLGKTTPHARPAYATIAQSSKHSGNMTPTRLQQNPPPPASPAKNTPFKQPNY